MSLGGVPLNVTTDLSHLLLFSPFRREETAGFEEYDLAGKMCQLKEFCQVLKYTSETGIKLLRMQRNFFFFF